MSALASGAVSRTAAGPTTASLLGITATGGTSPYTYQWCRSTVTGFTPGSGNFVAGATSLTLNDTGLQSGTTYYYVLISTDSAGTPAVVNSSQVTVVTSPAQNQNQFAPGPQLGMLDQAFNYNTKSCQIDISETAVTDAAGTAVKIVATSTGVMKVVACAANSDACAGFLVYNVKNITFQIGNGAEIAQAGNVIYLLSVGAISAGAQVQLDLTYAGGVKTITGSSGAAIVGWAMDAATADGQLIRIHLSVPSFSFA
jgi:hypothetical protein